MTSGPAPVNLHEYEPLARARLTEGALERWRAEWGEPEARRRADMAWEYLSGGSGDEVTLRRNRSAFDALQLHPRSLVDVSALDTSLTLLGETLPFPILLAPTAFHRLFHPEGELATVRGAALAGAVYVASTAATTTIEEIGAAASGPMWFQLYSQRDRGLTRELVARAEASGARALVLTVDTPVLGARDRERRSAMELPPGLEIANFRGVAAREAHLAPFHREIFNPFLDPTLTWAGVEWLRSIARIPLLVKGVISPDDARHALDAGVAGIVVSNHGGRNLDTLPATIEALPRVADAVGGQVPLLVDGGIRRGVDVLKALALGAQAVLIGRPYLWGLMSGGAEGVRDVVALLRSELEMAMALSGRPRLADIERSVLWR